MEEGFSWPTLEKEEKNVIGNQDPEPGMPMANRVKEHP